MPRLVKATFSNGHVLERSSVSKVYTHAYLIKGTYGGEPTRTGATTWGHSGFSSSEEQCLRNMASESAWSRKRDGSTTTFEEVVAVEVIEKRTQPTAHARDMAQLASDEASERILHAAPGEC